MQKTCQNKCEKNPKTCEKKCEKNTKKNKTHANCMFLHFLEGVLSGLQIFQKLQKTEVKCKKKQKNATKMPKKMRNKCKNNAKKMQILEMCMFYKNKFPEVAFFFCIFACIFFALFLHFPGPRFLGLHFLGAFFLHFNQVLQSLE